MWPETRPDLESRMKAVHERASSFGRTLDYGLRCHVIVRDTEAEAREYAAELVSKLDDDKGTEIRERALDSTMFILVHIPSLAICPLVTVFAQLPRLV